jgi:cytochrome P450
MTGNTVPLWLIACVAIAVLPPMWLATVYLSPAFERTMIRSQRRLGVAALAWCALTLALAFVAPVAVIPMAVVGVGVAIFMMRGRIAGVRARSVSGDSRQAPGSLSFTQGVRALANRGYYLEQFATHGPVFRMSQYGAPTICVFGLDKRQQIMAQHGAQLGPSPLPFSQSVMKQFLRYMDDATHNTYGPLIRRAMRGPTTAALHEAVNAACARGLTEMHASTAAAPSGPLLRVARRSLNALMFGFDERSPHSAAFDALSTSFYGVRVSKALRHREEAMLGDLVALLAQQEAWLQATPAMMEYGGPPLARLRGLDPAMPDETCLQNFVFMHRIATNNVGSLLNWMLYYWATQPEVVAEIRAREGPERVLAQERFLAETLRLSQSEYTYRRVAQAFEHEGIAFPAGWLVRFCVWESHRAATPLDDPLQFHLRLGEQDYARSHYAPFGTGRHACNGVDMNQTICLAVLEALTAADDVVVERAEPFQRFPRHWGHWQPNQAMRVRRA